MAKNKNTTVLNWEGEAGGRGIRALTRYIYQPPAVDNLTALNNIYSKMTGFFMVGSRCSHWDKEIVFKIFNPIIQDEK